MICGCSRTLQGMHIYKLRGAGKSCHGNTTGVIVAVHHKCLVCRGSFSRRLREDQELRRNVFKCLQQDTSGTVQRQLNRTPAMIGCSFVVHRKFFGEIGLLDPGMDVYGGENIELGIKVWLCGGSMEVLPCSRVAHIERKKKPYNNNIGFYTKRNALRVAEVWMDDYKSHVYIAWNLPLENPGIDIGDVSERKALRKSLKCKNFQWYLDHVYPEMRRYNNTVAYGELRNNKAKDVCLDQGPQENHTAILYPCHGWGPQLARYTKEGFLHLGALGTTTLLPDTRCLVDNVKSRFPQLLDCEKVKSSLHKRWNFIQNGAILNKGTGRCLEVENRGMAGIDLILRSCTGQRWTIKNFIK
ncbi:polypeptide N-acetylgalactosaminyltransferase 17 isoform X3 [Anas platyrhynchos]|uniref:polypeptide N-acetylgalactosaminyltransferase 17 isoform X3 n=1 Tax=Anas platyrhynchos TaxID=8839 RepID=UPI000F7C7A94|eukprot:XP_027301706.1 polypeptide N-acetylgalactosaminyltransferase 17 isoform X2 [Anas platyrhynchos]